MTYLRVFITREKLGEAFDELRRHDDIIGWSGFGVVGETSGGLSLNPMKAITRSYLLNYADSMLKNTFVAAEKQFFFTFDENAANEEIATFLALKYGTSVTRSASL